MHDTSALRRSGRHRLGVMLGAVACLFAVGCRREPEVKVKTPDEVKAEIRKVEADTKMPANVKGMVLGLLRKELEQAEKHAKQGK